MKKKEIQELATKDIKELLETIKIVREELFSSLLDLSQNKLKNTSLISKNKKKIAVMLTKVREKELLNG